MLGYIARAIAYAAVGGVGLVASVAAFSGSVANITLARLAASGFDPKDLTQAGKDAVRSAVNE